MEVKDILKLIDAGFTKDEIMSVVTTSIEASQSVSESAPAVSEEVIAEAEKPAESLPEQPQEDKTAAMFKSLSDEIAAVKKEVFKYNIRNQVVASQPKESSTDILAGLINPNLNGGK